MLMGNYSLTTSLLMVVLVYILIVFLILSNYFGPSTVYSSEISTEINVPNSNNNTIVDGQGSKTTNQKRRIQAKSGLYLNSKHVTEIADEQHLKDLVAEKNPMMVVFYASWCGHCRNFVPIYTSIAQTTTDKIVELNSFQDAPAYKNMTFAGVNCVAFRDLCTKHSIQFFPTVIAINFPSMKGNNPSCRLVNMWCNTSNSENTKIQGIKNDILKFLKTNYFTHNELDNTSIAASIKKSVVESKSVSDALLPIPSHRAHVGSNVDRMHDAWVSYLYFLTNELPSEVTTVKAQKLQALVELVDRVLPIPSTLSNSQAVKGKLVEEVKILLYKYSRSAYVPRDKLVQSVQQVLKIHNVEIRWRACGVNPKDPKASGHSDPVKGYTCGVWMLFHLLSIHAGKPLSPLNQKHLVPATDVMVVMHDFIEEFFGCHSCKLHFLHYYKLCWYGRCDIKENDYEALQLWLFYLHNFVSCRIYLEKLPSARVVSTEMIESLIRNKLWPAYSLCPDCYLAPVTPLDLSKQDAFFPKVGQTIKKHTVSEEEKYLESLIHPQLEKAFNRTIVLNFLHSNAFNL